MDSCFSNFFLGQREHKLQPASLVVLGRDGAAMDEDRVLHDGQSEAGASQLARASFVYAVEALEQAVQVLRGNAYTCVRKAEVIEILVLAGMLVPA